jgi:hypothetical protein
MISPLSSEKCKEFFGVEFARASNLSQLGGAKLYLWFINKVKLRERLEPIVGRPAAKALLQVMVGVLAGADSMEKVARICKDKVCKQFIPYPYCATQIKRVLEKISPAQIQAVHELSLSLALLDIAESADRNTKQHLEIDATAKEKYGHQEGVEKGYLDRDVIAPCYQYLFIRNSFLNTLVWGTIRGGSAHSQNNIIPILKMVLPHFAGLWSVTVRMDSGFYNEKTFSLCSKYSIEFYIKAPMTGAVLPLATSSTLVWGRRDGDDDAEYAVYDTITEDKQPFRLMFKRERLAEKNGELLPGYKYHAVATNNLTDKPWEAFAAYNGRASIENTNCEMKNDYHLGKIVTDKFGVNDLITQMTIIAYQIMSHFRRHCLDKAFRNARLSSLRTILFNVPARMLTSGRREWSRVYNAFVDVTVYGRILARQLRYRTTWAIAPPS